MKPAGCASALLLYCAALSVAAEPGAVVFDFESGDLQGWKVVEGSFDTFVCDRRVFHHSNKPYNNHGKIFLSTLEQKNGRPNDTYTGVAESPVVTLAGPKIQLLVGGGKHKDTYVALCTLDGKEVAYARGGNTQTMRAVEWNVPQLVGKPVFLRIFDGNTGGWGHVTLDHVRLAGRVDAAATKKRFQTRKKVQHGPLSPAPGGDRASLLAAVKDLAETFGERYPKGRAYRDRIEGAAAAELDEIRREALVANPLVSGRPLVFVTRPQYRRDHHNTATMFQTGEINTRSYRGGGALKKIDFAAGGKVTIIHDPGPEGTIRDPGVSFDGERIVFSMRKNIEDDYHIYEINADGSGLRQLTAMPGVFDIDPVYISGGDIIFTSSREPKYCMCNRHIMGNLYRMEGDGANIYQIGKSTLFEGHAAVMPDGRILYYRWEYVDRNFGDAQGLWVVNPDGTNHAIYWGNNTNSPGGVIDGRIIPGTQLCLCTFTSCHDRPWGAVAIIDRSRGVDGREPVVGTWPADAVTLVGKGNYDMFKQVKPKYEDPYPLDDDYFLASRQVGKKEQMGIFLLDTFGNEILLHTEPPGCYDPMPLAPRKNPPVKPITRDFKNENGIFYIQDVYIGTHMDGVERGDARYLRVVESPEKKNWTHPSWGGQGVHCPGINWHSFENKRVLGTVPVEPDGSAHFSCPADRFVFFQLLDENGMMIQSMRSGTIIQSGERQGCVGCHENRVRDVPGRDRVKPAALGRPPDPMEGFQGETRIFSFQRDVQPIFDARCVKCHDFGKPAGKKLRLCGDRAVCFSASYVDLWSRGFINCVGGGPAAIRPPRSWGSHASTLTGVIRGNHPKHEKDLELTEKEVQTVITWMDLNAPYYPYYESAYPRNPTGRCPVNNGKLKKLGKLTGAKFVTRHGKNQRTAVSFDRPEKSPCLAKLKKGSPQYRAALAIIAEGKANLAKTPRADMEGFVPCEKDRDRLRKYEKLRGFEMRNRAAIRAGKKVYDPGIDR